MRIDPLEVFAHAITSTLGRFGLVYLVAALGSLAPPLANPEFASIGDLLPLLLFFPLYLLWCVFASGWWSFAALPLFAILLVRAYLFVRDEGQAPDLFWLFILPCLICVRGGGESWPWIAGLAGLTIFIFVRGLRPCRRKMI